MHNPFWLGTPHSSTEDFEYQGMHIPKDTVVILNTVCIETCVVHLRVLTAPQWTMHFDPERYPDPEKFNVRHSIHASDSCAHICPRTRTA